MFSEDILSKLFSLENNSTKLFSSKLIKGTTIIKCAKYITVLICPNSHACAEKKIPRVWLLKPLRLINWL